VEIYPPEIGKVLSLLYDAEMPAAAFPDTATASNTSAEPKKNGRPTLYSPELLEKLCAGIRQHGWTDHRAALLLGVNPKNLTRWKQAHEDFGPALEIARSEFLSAQLQAIAATETKSGLLNWRARAWLIERTFPEEYGRRAPAKVEPPDPDVEEDKDFDPTAPGAFAGVITPFKLHVLQQLRLEQLEKLQAQKAAGISPAPDAPPPVSLSAWGRSPSSEAPLHPDEPYSTPSSARSAAHPHPHHPPPPQKTSDPTPSATSRAASPCSPSYLPQGTDSASQPHEPATFSQTATTPTSLLHKLKQGFLGTKPSKPPAAKPPFLASTAPCNAAGQPMDGFAAPIPCPTHPAWLQDPIRDFTQPNDDHGDYGITRLYL
jgi:transposase